MIVHGVEVYGDLWDGETRCVHYHGARDVVAVRFACCDRYYPCVECHRAHADHPAAVWPRDRFDAGAVLCGRCGHELTIAEYLGCGAACPNCGAGFNPRCDAHHHLYFDMGRVVAD